MPLVVRFIKSCAIGALDAALFYTCVDSALGLTVTWPLVLAVAWIMQANAISDLRRKDETRAKREAIAYAIRQRSSRS